MGIEPTAQAWEAWVLPLYDARLTPIVVPCSCERQQPALTPAIYYSALGRLAPYMDAAFAAFNYSALLRLALRAAAGAAFNSAGRPNLVPCRHFSPAAARRAELVD
jgi:hypothetical protein